MPRLLSRECAYLEATGSREDWICSFDGRGRSTALPEWGRLISPKLHRSFQLPLSHTTLKLAPLAHAHPSACIKHGTHYLDLCGEPNFIARIIPNYDFAASKSGSVCIPMCAFESAPG